MTLRSSKRRNRRSHIAVQTTSLRLENLEPRMLLAGDLVASWTADDLNESLPEGGQITDWNDSVAGISAVASGEPTLVRGALNGRSVITFDGDDAFRVQERNNPLGQAEDFSIAVVFRTSVQPSGGNGDWYENTGLVDASVNGLDKDYGVTINAAGQISSGLTGGLLGPDGQNTYSTETGLNDGQEHIAIVTRSGGTVSVSVDGGTAASMSGPNDTRRSLLDLTFGSTQTDENLYIGEIAQIRLYDGALDQAEITTLNSELSGYYNNTAPVAVDDVYTPEEDALLFIGTSVLANDTDAEGDTLVPTLVTETQHGTLSFNANGTFVYDSDNNFNGTDSFTYFVSDLQDSNTATVTINVQPVYDRPGVTTDFYKIRPNETLSVNAADGVLANDTNADNLNFVAQLTEDVGDGELTFRPDGSFDYNPNGFAGPTSFKYTVDDGAQGSVPVTVNISVNTEPIGNTDSFSVDEDSILIANATDGVLANDTDNEGDTLTVTLVDDVANGELGIQASGALIYQPFDNFNGIDIFSYTVSDGNDETGPITATITVNSINDLPSAAPDAFYTLPGRALTIAADRGLLINDFDIDGPAMSTILANGPSNGTVALQPDGSFVYTPNAGFEGEDSFTYRASDSLTETAPVDVTISVLSTPLRISEILASNLNGIETRTKEPEDTRFRGTDLTPDWIEIQSMMSHDVDISGVQLLNSAEAETDEAWTFPAGTILPGNGFLTVFATGLDVQDTTLDENMSYHTDFRLSDAGEYLGVRDIDGTILDEFADFPRQLLDTSYGRSDSGSIGYFLTPSFGEANGNDARTAIVEEPVIETEHGFFTEPVSVSISSEDAAATIRYTIDGSEPTESSAIYTAPLTFDETTTLRAATFRDGFLPSRIDSANYLFLDDIINEVDEAPPEGWPSSWGANEVDYGMDRTIIDSDIWGPQMMEAMTQIPTMALSIPLDSLFDSSTGIYARAGNDGKAWERPGSLELINPDGSEGFQTNIGLRIRGGFSRSNSNPKHAFRVFFDTQYGDGRLDFPLFGDDGADSFAKIDLRTSQNYSWSFQNDSRNTMLRDIYSRDLQRAMGHESTRGEYYHLMINGVYWGIFQTDERPSADWGASYYGGNAEDYDVLHNDPRAIAATDGNTDAYQRLFEFFDQDGGLSDANMVDYYKAQGMNPDGTRNSEFERLLDVDNLIDYMIITYYTSDADGPGSKFTRPGINNYFIVYNREDPDGFKHIEHDSEHSLDTGNAAGANYNMVTPLVDNGGSFSRFNGHHMHEVLASGNSDYRQRFVDRVTELFQDDGLLGDESVRAMLQTRADQIDMAIIAESARWGDSKRSTPFTKTTWDNAVQTTLNFTERSRDDSRRIEVIKQLQGVDWYPDDEIVAPAFSADGGQVNPGFSLTITAGMGTLYYTSDGSDPRMSGGGVNPEAIMISSGDSVTINSGGVLKARTLEGDVWSPLTQERFLVETPASIDNFRISELYYNPASTTDAEEAAGFTDKDDFEFIELINISNETIDLSTIRLTNIEIEGRSEGVDFDFADSNISKLAAGERVLVVENLAAFESRYGTNLPVAGQWLGGLRNSMELITLSADDGTNLRFTYSDQWYPTTDGDGFSLEVINPANVDLDSWNEDGSWAPSGIRGGTPGSGSDTPLPGDSTGDGIFDSADLVAVFQAGEYEDGVAGNSTFAEGDWNGDGDFDSTDLVLVFQQGNYVNAAVSLIDNRDIAAALDGLQTGAAADSASIVTTQLSPTPRTQQRPIELDPAIYDAVFAEEDRQSKFDANEQSGLSLDDLLDDIRSAI